MQYYKAYKYYKKRRDSSDSSDSEDFFTLCVFIDEELQEQNEPDAAIDIYGNVKNNG